VFTVKRRQEVERAIVRATIEEAEKQGWRLVRVSNGEDNVAVRSIEEALEHAFACDEAHVYFAPEHTTDDKWTAWFYVVLGNDGWDVICDYTTNLDLVINATDALVAKYEQEAQS
jgi:DNA-binding transcriptional regulator LsrR (DeoR family)